MKKIKQMFTYEIHFIWHERDSQDILVYGTDQEKHDENVLTRTEEAEITLNVKNENCALF